METLAPAQPETEAQCESPVREILADGSVKSTYPDGSSRTLHPGGGWTSCWPDERTGEIICSIALALSVPRIIPTSDLASIDSEWLNEMNEWMEHVSETLLGRIRTLASDEPSVQRYLAYEDSVGAELYERVDLRLETSEKLLALIR